MEIGKILNRMCIGKRFAEMEVLLGVCNLLQNFRMEWAADYDLDPLTELVNVPDRPIRIRFIDLNSSTA
jgi:cytochrome P450 family 12